MGDWKRDIEDAVAVYVTVTELACSPLPVSAMQVQYLPAPHRPPSSLPTGKMAVYGFWYDGAWLKIGMAGAKSNARYVSQHYSPGNAMSTLAGSLLKDPAMARQIDAAAMPVGQWMRAHCCRVNILLGAEHGVLMLAMLEAFLHLRLRPRYEK